MGRVVAKKLATWIVWVACALASGCTGQPDGREKAEPTMLVSRGVVTASHGRYIESGGAEPAEQFSFIGTFIKYNADDSVAVDTLIGPRWLDLELSLDGCTLPAPAVDEGGSRVRSKSAIELLDVGDLTVAFGDQRRPVPTRTFPDLLKAIVGVIYSADESQGVAYRPGLTYDLHVSGADEVAPFDVAIDAPPDLGDVRVDGFSPEDKHPVLRRAENLELTWDEDGYGHDVIAAFSWTSMGAPWSMACRMRDDGIFVVPEAVTAALPDPMTCADGEITLSRVRQVPFSSPGLPSGTFRFVVSTTFPVDF